MTFFESVYEQVSRIPAGKVATYGQIARLAGSSRSSRVVGYALHSNPKPGVIPCHRVVFKDGSLSDGFAFGGWEAQYKLLLSEGVVFCNDTVPKVDMNTSQWCSEES
ncbi:MAG: MGMT family protein [Bifidobacteriaceae bacterium]|nr:MGMT family protein [Bifidobacteriaceae bacterium]